MPLCLCVFGVPAPADTGRLLAAIEQVESGGHPDPSQAIGDGGRSRGPLQIQFAYWLDTRRPGESRTRAAYLACVHTRAGSRDTVLRYWRRYCPAANDEMKSRIHNGGPRGHRKSVTLGYWRKVRAAMGDKQ